MIQDILQSINILKRNYTILKYMYPMHAYIHTYKHTYIYIHTHTHTYTHILYTHYTHIHVTYALPSPSTKNSCIFRKHCNCVCRTHSYNKQATVSPYRMHILTGLPNDRRQALAESLCSTH